MKIELSEEEVNLCILGLRLQIYNVQDFGYLDDKDIEESDKTIKFLNSFIDRLEKTKDKHRVTDHEKY